MAPDRVEAANHLPLDRGYAITSLSNYLISGSLRVQQLIKKSIYGANLAPNVITLSLRSPSQETPVQQWTFVDQPLIKIGRCPDNHIVLHSSVVSRHHVELRHIETQWKVINFGNNGTYLDGQPITEAIVTDGTIVRLAISGPQLQINLGSTTPEPLLKNVLSREVGSLNKQSLP